MKINKIPKIAVPDPAKIDADTVKYKRVNLIVF